MAYDPFLCILSKKLSVIRTFFSTPDDILFAISTVFGIIVPDYPCITVQTTFLGLFQLTFPS